MARYSLNYYESLFPTRGPGFEELVEALAQELEDYARDLSVGVDAGWGASELARVRHSHRPLVVNLGLHDLEDLEGRVAGALGSGLDASGAVTAFVDEARSLARELRSELPGRPFT